MHSVVSLRHQFNILKTLYKSINSTNPCRLHHKFISSSKCDLSNRRWCSSHVQIDSATPANSIRDKGEYFEFHHEWPTNIRDEFQRNMIVIENFVTEAEEMALFEEVKKSMRRMRYQYDHWDDAIHGYREMEKADWLPDNEQVIQRMRAKAFEANVLPHVHILDLAADGIIKPHVDSSRYCGSTIAGLSLLTDCIMRLKRVDESKYKQNRFGEEEGEQQEGGERNGLSRRSNYENSNWTDDTANEFNYFVDVLLKRRSLYIMKDSARYNFSHEVLPSNSTFAGKEVVKERRISIICRNQP